MSALRQPLEDLVYDAGTCLDLLKSAERDLSRAVLQADHLHAIADGGITSDDVEGLIESIRQARVTVHTTRTGELRELARRLNKRWLRRKARMEAAAGPTQQ